MKYFWKLGIIFSLFILSSLIGAGTALAKDQQTNPYQRYDLPYESSTSASTATPKSAANTAPAKKTTSTANAKKAKSSPSHIIYSKQVVTESRNVPPFSAIDIAGPFKVNLVSGDGRQKVVLKGNVNAVPLVTSRVVGNTLVLRVLPPKSGSLVPPYDPRVTVQIHMPREIVAITTGGTTAVYGQGVYSPRLLVTAKDQSSVYLSGRISVYEIFCSTSGNIDIALGHVRGLGIGGQGSGLIRVTGSADVLTAVLGGGQRLDASHLRTREVYIETWGSAMGQVQPVTALYAFARGNSNIFYYRKPQVMSGNSRDSGNILQLGNW